MFMSFSLFLMPTMDMFDVVSFADEGSSMEPEWTDSSTHVDINPAFEATIFLRLHLTHIFNTYINEVDRRHIGRA